MIKDFINGNSTWSLKSLTKAIDDLGLPDPNNTGRDLNLVFALARACAYKDAASRKAHAKAVLKHALIRVACTGEDGTLQYVEVLNDIWCMLRQHGWPRLRANIDDVLELCLYESSIIGDEPNHVLLDRFVRDWLDWQYSQLFEEIQPMAEAREQLCTQLKTGDVDKVIAACMRLIFVTSDVTGNDDEDIGCQALDCMFWVQELAKVLDERYLSIMSD